MNPLCTDLPIVFLNPGELFFANRPALVHTLLGSCVSVALFDRSLRAGSICHSISPRVKGACTGECGSCRRDLKEAFKYVDSSITFMLSRFKVLGIRDMDELEVKVFGGAAFYDTRRVNVGYQNLRMAYGIIESKGLKVSASNTGGSEGRKIFFYTHTGKVILRPIKVFGGGDSRRSGNFRFF
ncbi:MAG: chemotaxis protein CheD [Deltaproteobacteria bacterium]|nr:chemotaxis protein CheD [Deltaproteobacteria bacterium]